MLLARALLAHSTAAASGASELLLSAGRDLDHDLQAKAVALVDTLKEALSGRCLRITVQFASEA